MSHLITTAPDDVVDRERRFGGVARLYGPGALERLERASVCVVGVGGVGSPAVEALARSGVGSITLIDLDHVAESNINRQIHALETTLGQAKVEAMAERVLAINPAAKVRCIDDFVTSENAAAYLHGFDVVVDAIDNVRAKVAMVLACRAAGIRLVMAGGAGGKTDPARVRVDDLSRTQQDPLLAKVRRQLRNQHGYPRDPRRRFGIEAVYSEEPSRQPAAQGLDAACAPQGLSCAGYGSSMVVTATVGLIAASRALEALLVHAPDNRG